MRFRPDKACLAAATALIVGACASSTPDTGLDAVPATPVVVPTERYQPEPGALLSTPLEWQGLFDHARQLVEWRSSTSLAGLDLRLVDDEVISREINRETRRLVDAQFHDPTYADSFIKRISNAQSGTYLALYSAHEDAVLVSRQLLDHFLSGIRNEELAKRAALALFIHEAVHAADDRRHDINSVRTLDFRAAFAQSAVFEGHAQWQTRKLCVIAGCLDGLQALDRFMFGAAEPNQATQSANALSRNVIEYAYVEGERFIDALASRADGDQALERLLSNPPVDPIQILDPGSWPDNKREQRNLHLFAALEQLDHPWNSDRYERIQTSPLKGVNLRADPARRAAAVDGFTRLLSAMASMEIHAPGRAGSPPVDVTLLEGESDGTAVLFARTLHANNLSHADATELRALQDGDTTLYRVSRGGKNARQAYTVVGVRGRYIVQMAGVDIDPELMEDYALGALEQLAATRTARLSN